MTDASQTAQADPLEHAARAYIAACEGSHPDPDHAMSRLVSEALNLADALGLPVPSADQTADRWGRAIISVVEVLRGYAVMMENGEVPMLSGPLALIHVAKVVEGMPIPKEQP